MKEFRFSLFIDAAKQDVPAIILYVRSRIMECDGYTFTVNENRSTAEFPSYVGLDFVWICEKQSDLQWATEDMLQAVFPLIAGATIDTEEGEDLFDKTFPNSV